MRKSHFFPAKKGLALFLSLSVLVSGFEVFLPAARAEALSVSKGPLDLASLEIPEKWGFIEDVRLFESSPYSVVILQDAHAFPDAQEKLARLTRWLTEEKNVGFAALEGASGTLDTRLLKSFPDQALLEEVLSGYLSAGEISGSAAASVLTSSDARFTGLEDARLYADSVNAYLAVQALKDVSEEKLSSLKRELERISKPVLEREVLPLLSAVSEGSLTLPEQLEAFRRKLPANFLQETQERYPHVVLLFSEMSKTREAEELIRREVIALENDLRTVLNGSALKSLSGFRQQFETEMIPAEVYAEKLLELAENPLIETKISENLKQSLQAHRRLNSLKGLVLSREWESFRRSALHFLAGSEDTRTVRLLELWRFWELLNQWNRLELTSESWTELQRGLTGSGRFEEFSQAETELKIFWDSAGSQDPRRLFYQLAEERDQVFFARLQNELRRGSHASALFTAGGFHSRGLQKLLNEHKISHAVVTPAVQEVPAENLYPAYMRGDISWKSYFRIHKGKADVYDAFQTSVVARLAESLEKDKGHFFSVFRLWRQRLLSALAGEDLLNEAFAYTRFIDQALFAHLSEADRRILEKDWRNVLENFIQEIHRLKSEDSVTVDALARIPQAFKVVQWPAVMGFVKNATVPESWTRGRSETVIPESGSLPFSRAELRAEDSSPDESDEEPAVVIFNEPLKLEWKLFWKSIPIAALAAFEIVRRQNPAQNWSDLLLGTLLLTGVYVIGIGSTLLTMERKELKNHMMRRMIPAPSYETRELGEGLYETYINVPELFRVEAGERMPVEKFVNTAFHALELIPSQIHSLWIGVEPIYQRGEKTPNLEEILETARHFDFGRRPDHAGSISVRLRIIHGPAERQELRALPEPLSRDESARRFALLRKDLEDFQSSGAPLAADVSAQVRALNSQMIEALNGLVFREGYQLQFLGLDHFVMKLPEARPVGNISLMFIVRGGRLEADIGANLIPEERGQGILSDFRSFLAEVLPESIPLSSGIDNVPTLRHLLENLEKGAGGSSLGSSLRSRLREVIENYEPDFEVNTTLKPALEWRKVARDLLQEIYGLYPALMPGPDEMSETQLGRLNRHYGEAVTSVRLRGGFLEYIAERSELRNASQEDERFYSRLLDLTSEEPVTSILEDSNFVTNRALNEKLQVSIAVRYLDLFIWLVKEKGLVPEDLTELSEEIGFKVLKQNEVYLVSGTEEKLILAEDYQGFGPAQETGHPVILEWSLAEQALSAVLIALDSTETRFLKVEILQKRPRRALQPFNVNPLFSIQTRQPRLLLGNLLSREEEALPVRELVLRVSLASNPKAPGRAELRSETETAGSEDDFWPLFWNDPDHFTAVASGELGRGYYQHELKTLFDELLEDLDSGARVLDIAAGKGAAALALMQAAAANGKKTHIESIDAAASSIPLTLGESDVSFLRMPAEKLDYPENHFNAVTSFFGIEYSKLEESLPEAFRVLAPGGEAVFLLHSDESYLIADQFELSGAFPDILNAEFLSAAREIAQSAESEWKKNWDELFAQARAKADDLKLRPRPAREFRAVLERLYQALTADSPDERRGEFETVWGREMRRFRESYLAITRAFSMTKARQFVRDAERAGFRETSIRPFYYRGEQLGWLFEAVKAPLEKETKAVETPRLGSAETLPPRFLLHELGNLLTPLEAADSEIDPFGEPEKMEAVYGEKFYRDYALIKSRFQSTRNNFTASDWPEQVSKLLLDYARFFSPESMRPHLERIRTAEHPNARAAAEKLENAANWIYEMAKVYSGLEAEQIKTVRLSLLARDAAAGLGEGVRYEGGSIQDHFVLRTYPLELFRVMRNLVINAVHASDPAVTGRARDVRVMLAELNPDENSGYTSRIDVQDNGTGIAPEILPRIFEPFFTTKGDKGTGVGLSMVRQSVEEKLGGKLEVETRVGEGTVFTVYLPEMPETRSELRQTDPENPEDLTRRQFLSAGTVTSLTTVFLGGAEESSGQEPKRAGASRQLVLPQNPFMRSALLRELYGDTQSGLSQMIAPDGLPYNQAPTAARPAAGWMKSADPGFLWMTDVLAALNHRTLPLGTRGSYSDPRAVTARIKKSLALYKKTVETFGLKIDGVNTGILPEILIYERDGFRTEVTTIAGTDNEKGVAYAAYDMALTHLRLKVLAEIFRGGYVRGLEDAEIVKTAEELLKQADYRVFLDGEKNIRMQVFEKPAGAGVVQSPALIDNRHTEARGFFLIAELFSKPEADLKKRREEGLKVLAKLKQEWLRLPAAGGEFVAVGKGDANLTAWTEYEGLQFLDAAEVSPGALRKSAQNYFKAAEELARQKDYAFAATAPGSGERPQVYEPYGLKKPEVTVPAGIFLALLSDLPEAVQNAEKFLRAAKRQRGYAAGWGLADSYDPKSAKPFHTKRIFMNQALILESLGAPLLRYVVSQWEDYPEIRENFKAFEKAHPAPETLKELNLPKMFSEMGTFTQVEHYPGNDEMLSSRGVLKLNYRVDEKNTFSGFYGRIREQDLRLFKSLRLKFSRASRLPERFRIELKGAAPERKILGTVETPVLKAGETYLLDISKLTAASEKVSEIVIVFEKEKAGKTAAGSVELEEMILSPAEAPARQELREAPGAEISEDFVSSVVRPVLEDLAAGRALRNAYSSVLKDAAVREFSTVERLLRAEAQDPSYAVFWSERNTIAAPGQEDEASRRELFRGQLLADLEEDVRSALASDPQKKMVFAFGYRLPSSVKARESLLNYLEHLNRIRGAFPAQVEVEIRLMVLPHELQLPEVRAFFREAGRLGVAKAVEMTSASAAASLKPYLDHFSHALVYGLSNAGLLAEHPFRAVLSEVEPGEELPVVMVISRILAEESRIEITAERLGKLTEFLPGILQMRGGVLAITRLALEIAERFQTAQLIGRSA